MSAKKPTHRKHNKWHDYKSRCIYHITLVVSDRVPLFGRMEGASVDDARVEFTPLGQQVCDAIQMIPMKEAKKGNVVQILGAATMPEHIHFVLFVRKPMKEKLGLIIRGFKQGCNKALRGWLEMAVAGGVGDCGLGKPAIPNGEGEAMGDCGLGKPAIPNGEGEAMGVVGSPCGAESFANSPRVEAFLRQLISCGSSRILNEHALFEEDFDETRLRRDGQLKTMIAYVHNNPRHRWQKQHNRAKLCVTRGVVIAGRSYDAIGNLMLLGLKRFQLHCRYRWERDHDIEARRAHQNECVKMARLNYALVSPFIMDHEKEVLDFCLKEGHSVIMLMDNGFTDFTTCPGGLFDYCDRGQVLLLVPSELPRVERKGKISRAKCMMLNARAEEIVGENGGRNVG